MASNERFIESISTAGVPDVIGPDGCVISQGYIAIYAVDADGLLWFSDSLNHGNWIRLPGPTYDQ